MVGTARTEEVSSRPARSRELLNKVPEITLYFWIIKILATTVGETLADYLNVTLGWGLVDTSFILGAVFLVALYFQMRARRYIPWLYWLVVVLISIMGTLITDNLSDNLGVPKSLTTVAFGLALAATFVAWYACEGTLSIHSIRTTRREGFYWLAILFTFALGTAGGDLIAEQINLGYPTSALVFAVAIAVVTVAHLRFGLNPILAFWIAYILTRPQGASLGDLLSQPTADGGLGVGTTVTSVVFLAVIAGLVAYLTMTGMDTAAPARSAGPATAKAPAWLRLRPATTGESVERTAHRAR